MLHAEPFQPFIGWTCTRCFDQRHRLHHQLRRQATEFLRQCMGIVLKPDAQSAFQQHRTGVQAFLHGHHADAGFRITVENRPLNRGRPPPARQQRTVTVPTPQWRLFQHLERQDLAEGHHHRCISLEGCQLRLAVRIFLDPFRREHRQVEVQGLLFHGRSHQLLTPPSAAIRLTHHPNDRVPGLMQLSQGGDGIGRCSPVEDAQGQASPVMERPSTQTWGATPRWVTSCVGSR